MNKETAKNTKKFGQNHKIRFSGFYTKFLVLALIISLNWVGVLGVGRTAAYYYDNETSKGNFLGADLLDFIIEGEGAPQCENWTTYTQGGWGTEAHGNNPGVYRDNNFAGAFPSGAVIGNPSGYTALFNSSLAVENFLAAGTAPGSFTQNYIDPISTSAGVLAGQTLALTLSLGFDNYDSNFGESDLPLSGWVVSEGPDHCNGKTVQEILNESNNVLASLASVFSASQANECVAYINEKFDEGQLSCQEESINPLDWGKSVEKEAKVKEVILGVDWKHRVRTEKTGGLDDFCNALNLEVFLDNVSVYNGDLVGFISTTQLFGPDEDRWTFLVNLPIGAPFVPKGEICQYDFIYEGWQNEFPVFPNGFSDVERISNKITSGQYSYPIVINEFLPNPIGNDYDLKPNGEWVELYNLSANPIDVAGWYLYDNSNSHPLPITLANSDNNGDVNDGGETIVPGSGFMVVYLDGAYGPGWLNNSGNEKIRLFDGPIASGNLVDSYSFNGALENKSFARIPDGTGDFVDPIPTPLRPNVAEEPTVLFEIMEPELSDLELITSGGSFLEDNTIFLEQKINESNYEEIKTETETSDTVIQSEIIELQEIAANDGNAEEILPATETVIFNTEDSQTVTEEIIEEVLAEERVSSDEVLLQKSDLQSETVLEESIQADEQLPVQETVDESLQAVAETSISLPEEIITAEEQAIIAPEE